ncbi:MAG TPA: hypothetical protein VMV29_01020 [Ktedonobacterales bacterium]|nr:hypothetical protein [Ktedonobacterales bacterium]
MTTSSQGVGVRIRAWAFGERDEVAAQLKEVANQGRGLARVAHFFAFLLIILFSLMSLVALSSDALIYIVGQYQTHGMSARIIPDAINVAVAVALVIVMDTGMLIAASTLRTLRARRAPLGDMWLHAAILTSVALIEAGTYLYAAWEYDQPHTLPAWVLLAARAIMAPILGVYLSMANVTPVGARDVLHHVELGVGTGFLRDAIRIANDADAPLAHKAHLYKAASVMTAADETRLNQVIDVLQQGDKPAIHEPGFTQRPSSRLYVPQTLNTSGVKPRLVRSDADAAGDEPPDAPPDGASRQRQSRSPLPFRKSRVAVKRSPERIAFDLLDATPDASDNTIMRAAHVGRERAKQLRTEWQTQRAQEAQG